MPFLPGDEVHVAALGKGVVREVRNGGRYLVEMRGRSVVADEGQLAAMATKKRPAMSQTPHSLAREPRGNVPTSLDLHGMTVAEALAAVDEFLNDALLAGHAEVRVIHGRTGGRIKGALHKRLKALSVVRAFRLDPANAGVTVVTL